MYEAGLVNRLRCGIEGQLSVNLAGSFLCVTSPLYYTCRVRYARALRELLASPNARRDNAAVQVDVGILALNWLAAFLLRGQRAAAAPRRRHLRAERGARGPLVYSVRPEFKAVYVDYRPLLTARSAPCQLKL